MHAAPAATPCDRLLPHARSGVHPLRNWLGSEGGAKASAQLWPSWPPGHFHHAGPQAWQKVLKGARRLFLLQCTQPGYVPPGDGNPRRAFKIWCPGTPDYLKMW